MKVEMVVCMKCGNVHWSGGTSGKDEFILEKLTPCSCGFKSFLFHFGGDKS